MVVEWVMAAEDDTCELYSDASAAVSIPDRQGAGKMRHINVRSLWRQEKSLQEFLHDQKIKGEDNPADGLAKYATTAATKLSSDRARSGLKLSN